MIPRKENVDTPLPHLRRDWAHLLSRSTEKRERSESSGFFVAQRKQSVRLEKLWPLHLAHVQSPGLNSVCAHMCTRTQAHTRTHARTHTRTHARTHTHTHPLPFRA